MGGVPGFRRTLLKSRFAEMKGYLAAASMRAKSSMPPSNSWFPMPLATRPMALKNAMSAIPGAPNAGTCAAAW